MPGQFIIPLITGVATYYEGIQGIFGFIPGFLERPFQAFASGFLSSLALAVVTNKTITTTLLKDMAYIGAGGAVGAILGGVVGGMLGFDLAMSSAIGAFGGAYMVEDKLSLI